MKREKILVFSIVLIVTLSLSQFCLSFPFSLLKATCPSQKETLTPANSSCLFPGKLDYAFRPLIKNRLLKKVLPAEDFRSSKQLAAELSRDFRCREKIASFA